ncbi:alpha/beta hydrolase fold domain-containing protein [Rhodococcus hoagii]|uniref:alpha/beta hydrolase n=1 Tax=Rhodococcus hoagii TaxID=43767 RepID=UPI0009C14127|nr:alpha/beta hydrolase [Prescottella equi]MBM4468595.1 alpha/beta hydrolase fold domain-containing protein [Prescottella equi]MBM4723264.1 alpha/beta hydrolase fold domain-containing protein [Prescottella equi]MBM4725806.1 alpha/beta hydrolase fold domain-containing protein [Prescottella equi]MBM4734011.1 alpha/beta hydrolase fold domain-containing protein [Prescottella equi]MBM9837548.1 alpha/beta hydrolase [Prescottella equi]
MTDPQIDVDYNVRNTVSPELFDATVEEYRQRSRETVDGLDGFADVRFDPDSTERLDVWGVGGALRPVFVAIHGGYWRALSRHHTAFMAGMLADAGIATVAVDYGLAPHTPLEEIVRQVRAAVAWVYHHGAEHGLDRNRIVVGGSSAGGHLTATTMVSGWQAEFGIPDDVVRAAMPISGLFDIRPLVDSFANEWLGLDDSRASALSPMLQTDRVGPRAVVAVAEHDGVGFLEQSRKFHEAWARRSESELLVVPDRNHYDIFLDLAEPDSALGRALLGLFAGLEQA